MKTKQYSFNNYAERAKSNPMIAQLGNSREPVALYRLDCGVAEWVSIQMLVMATAKGEVIRCLTTSATRHSPFTMWTKLYPKNASELCFSVE
jgi:hypothetical protein